MDNQVTPWDFYFLYHLGRHTDCQNEIVTDPSTFKINFNPGRNLYFHSYIKLGSDTSKTSSSKYNNTDRYVRLGFFVEEMDEDLHFSPYVIEFFKEQGVITTDGLFPLLGQDTAYVVDIKNCISSKFLQLQIEEGQINTKIVDKREVKTQIMNYSVVGYKVLNVANEASGVEVIKNEKSIELK